MAVLNDMTVVAPEALPETIGAIKREIARQFWLYYYARQDDVLIRRKVLFWSVAIYLRDLYPLFVTLFGSPDAN